MDDILVSARKGMVIVRSGKGETYREVPLNAEMHQMLVVATIWCWLPKWRIVSMRWRNYE